MGAKAKKAGDEEGAIAIPLKAGVMSKNKKNCPRDQNLDKRKKKKTAHAAAAVTYILMAVINS